MAGIWEEISRSSVCDPVSLPEPYTEALVTRDPGCSQHWLIGPHPILNRLAKQLRSDQVLCELLRERGVCFGFRVTDVPPLARNRQKSYGDRVTRATTDHSKQRRETKHQPVYSAVLAPTARVTDEFACVETYWATQTPQAHHIVEFNNLEAVGVSCVGGAGDLDYDRLPCVLLIAEFHQRYVSSVLKSMHKWQGRSRQLLKQLRPCYETIYRKQAPGLLSLWHISKIILDTAERKL